MCVGIGIPYRTYIDIYVLLFVSGQTLKDDAQNLIAVGMKEGSKAMLLGRKVSSIALSCCFGV